MKKAIAAVLAVAFIAGIGYVGWFIYAIKDWL
jgi:nitrate reductase NapE component